MNPRIAPSGAFIQKGTLTTNISGAAKTVTGVILTASSVILLTPNTVSGTLGTLAAPSASRDIAAGSFAVTSGVGDAGSTVDWVIL